MVETVTLQIPEVLYQRLVDTARATGRSLEEITLHALDPHSARQNVVQTTLPT